MCAPGAGGPTPDDRAQDRGNGGDRRRHGTRVWVAGFVIMRMKNHNGTGTSGLTLIEMLVVIVIITIIASISIPAFISIGRGYGMRHTTSTVFNHLALARQWAITHREKVEFHVESAGPGGKSTFWITVPREGGSDLELVHKITNSPDVYFDPAGSKTIVFKTDGGLSGVNDSILITDGSISKTIQINALTGAMSTD